MSNSINQRLLLAISLFLFSIDSSYSNQTSPIDNLLANDTSNRILNEKEVNNYLSTKLEQLALTVHRKEEGDRIRTKRQFNLDYHLPNDEGL